jgi:hypothetical protein
VRYGGVLNRVLRDLEKAKAKVRQAEEARKLAQLQRPLTEAEKQMVIAAVGLGRGTPTSCSYSTLPL